MHAVAKVLKSVFWAAVVFGPIFYFGSKALPMVTESIEFTRNMHARHTKKSQDKLDTLTEVEQAMASSELIPSDDPNLAVIEDDRSTNGTPSNVVAPASHKPAAAVPVAKQASIEITNENMNSFWDPAAEDRIQNMAISSELKRQILENYRRTGVLPEAVASTRKPASVNR